jgi:hypothetical protein
VARGKKKPRQPSYSVIFRDNPEMADTAIRVWQDVAEHLDANRLWDSRRARIADRYARTFAEYEYLYPTCAAEGPVKPGKNGGDMWNMKWGAVKDMNILLQKFEEALLISPKASNAIIAGSGGGGARPKNEFLD